VSSPKSPTDYSAQPAPPTGDEIHLPGPTILPLVAAIAITLIVIGTTIDWIFSAVGAVVLVLVVIRWIRDVRRDIAELPEEHH
jgi:membrane protein implicated in regulation of membrane protease activity